MALLTFGAETLTEIERARISMMARRIKGTMLRGRIQKRKTNFSKSSLSALTTPAQSEEPYPGDIRRMRAGARSSNAS